MTTKEQYGKLIFGLKVHQLRESLKLSFVELAELSGMSISYLNEIEKGKKYPKQDKIVLLARALNTTPEILQNTELPKSLQAVEELLRSNFLNELPLNLFGIELSKVVEIIANAPARVGAFIYTLVELSRNYALGEQNFYFAALKSYLELNNNYFEELEHAAANFIKSQNISTERGIDASILESILKEKFAYKIIHNGLDEYSALKNIRAVYVKEKHRLLLNSDLDSSQRAFQFGKELGFNVLNLKERAYTATLLKVNNFDEVLNHFKAGYFSAALLMPRDTFFVDVQAFLNSKVWDDGVFFRELLNKYNATPEMLFQRMTNVLPRMFGLENLFFLRILHNTAQNKFDINKELHLSRRHHPQGSSMNEQYCHRWISVDILKDLDENNALRFGIQRSIYHKTNDEYICFSVAKLTGDRAASVTIGIFLDENARKQIKFLSDVTIPTRIVSTTCERCDIYDCNERQAAPRIVKRREQRREINEALEIILKTKKKV